ncbi:MAG: glycosyltransferase [Spirochaetia bacterium]
MDREHIFKIAFISGKLGDVDGVSLEVDKWIYILNILGHEIYTFAGKYASPLKNVKPENQFLVKQIGFGTSQQQYYEKQFFPYLSKHPNHITEEQLKKSIDELIAESNEVAHTIFDIIKEHGIDVLVAQNTNAMPMTMIGGTAVHTLCTKMRLATIFHHHDFWWERSRFSDNRIETFLNEIMPPVDPGLEHIVISSYAAHILQSIKRVQPIVVPNCEDFENVAVPDEYNAHFRKEFGFQDDDILIVQPTRIVRRKRIEDSLRLVSKFQEKHPELTSKIKYIISLYQGDEPDENYIDQIKRMAEDNAIDLHMISDRIASVRGKNERGEQLFTNRDVLVNADLVTYMPVWEGFGNALLEAVAAKVPIVVTTYLVYKTDIMITGMDNIEVRTQYDDEGKLIIPNTVINQMYKVLTDSSRKNRMVEHNFKICKEEFGFGKLEEKLKKVLTEYGPEIRASRNRVKKSKARYSV